MEILFQTAEADKQPQQIGEEDVSESGKGEVSNKRKEDEVCNSGNPSGKNITILFATILHFFTVSIVIKFIRDVSNNSYLTLI